MNILLLSTKSHSYCYTKQKRESKLCIVLSLMLLLLFLCKLSSSCDPSLSSSVVTQKDSFSGYSMNFVFSFVLGSSSNSIYILYYETSPDTTVVRRINSDDSVSWMTAISFTPAMQSLSVDSTETNIYFAGNTNPLYVSRLLASSGSIVDVQTFSFIDGSSTHTAKLIVLSDNSGYYYAAKDGSNYVTICKYLFSSSTSASCQQLTNFSQRAYGQLKLSDTQFFTYAHDPSTYDLHFYKFTFANTSPDWSMKILCTSNPCSSKSGISHLSSDSSTIYSAFIYGSTTGSAYYVYYTTFSASSGSVLSTRYKSNVTCTDFSGSAKSGDYIVAGLDCSSMYLVIINIASTSFTFKAFSGSYLVAAGIDSKERFLVGGQLSSYSYTAKFPISSVDYATDFTASSTITMSALSSGTDDFVIDSGQTIGSAGTQSISLATYSNQTVTYSQVSSTCYSTKAAVNQNAELLAAADAEQTTYTSILVVSVGGVVALNAFNLASTASLWSMVNQVQILFLLLLTQGFIPDAIQTVISGPDFAVNPFESISFLQTNNYGSWTDKLKFNLNESSLAALNIESISTIYNLISFFATLAYAAFVHFTFYMLKIIVNKSKYDGKCARLVKGLLTKAFEIMTFGYYIRLLMEMNEYIVVSSINEVYVFNTGETLQILSAIFALLAMIGSVVWIAICIALSLSSYEIVEGEHNKLEEFFEGMKLQKRFRVFTAILMIRRFLFILFCVTLASAPSRAIIGLLVPIEVAFIVYAIIFKPFQEVKANIIQIVNEVSFFILLSALLVYNTSTDWTVTFSYIYMQIIIITNIINFVIVLVFAIMSFYTWIMKRLHKSTVLAQSKRNAHPHHELGLDENYGFHEEEKEDKTPNNMEKVEMQDV